MEKMGNSRAVSVVLGALRAILLVTLVASPLWSQAAAGFGWKRDGEHLVDVPEDELLRRMGYSPRLRNLYLGTPEEDDRFTWDPAKDERAPRAAEPLGGRDLGSVGRRRFAPPLGGLPVEEPVSWSKRSPGDPLGTASEASEDRPLVPMTPEQFESHTQGLLDAVESFGQEPSGAIEESAFPQDMDFQPVLEPAEEILEAPQDYDLGALESFLGESGLDGSSVLEQSLTGGINSNTYGSAADGKSTTDSAYVKHLVEWRRGFGQRNDLALVNQLTVDSLRRGNVLDATFSRQVERVGAIDVQGTLTLHQGQTGEAEPDYHSGEFALSGRSDPLNGIGWDVRFYARNQTYQETDPFYLDNGSTSLQGGLRYSEEGFDLEGRHTLERDRYPQGILNDVDRILSEFTSYGTLGGFELSYYTQYQREGVKHVGELDAYRLWFNETTVTRSLGPKLALEYRLTRQKRSVDQPSEFLYDSRELGRRVRAIAGISPVFDGALGVSSYVVRNRPGAALVDETEDDREREDVELYLHYARSRLDASVTGYSGTTRYLNGQSEYFANSDRSGLSVIMGYIFSKAWRADLSYSLDVEDYAQYPINDTSAESLGLSGSVSF